MTIPYLMNCPHDGEGWCLACVKALGEENEKLRADRASAWPIIEAAMEARRFVRNLPGGPAVFAMLDQLEAALKPIDEGDAIPNAED